MSASGDISLSIRRVFKAVVVIFERAFNEQCRSRRRYLCGAMKRRRKSATRPQREEVNGRVVDKQHVTNGTKKDIRTIFRTTVTDVCRNESFIEVNFQGRMIIRCHRTIGRTRRWE